MTRGAVFFDVDGTLVPHTSSGRHPAAFLGHADINEQVEAGYGAGTLTSAEAAVLDARRGARLPLLTPTRGRHRRDRAVVPLPPPGAGAGHAGLGRGRRVPVRPFRLRPRLRPRPRGGRRPLQRRGGHPVRRAEQARLRPGRSRRTRRPPSRCAAVGDGRSDVPLFGAVGYAIALNATPAARAADVSVESTDLRVVLPHLRRFARAE